MSARRFSRLLGLALALAFAIMGGMLLAQVSGGDSSGNYEVSGVAVDVTGTTAEAARLAGWRLAQRKGWQMLSRRLGGGGGMVSDGTLDAMVSSIVIENEQIGPTRYVARLGVMFSRARAGALLGVAAEVERSAPMLTIPIEYSGGAGIAFEQKTEWQEAWARYRTGNSAIDYVRPNGTGPDAMLLNLGQTGRPGRGWWRIVLDQYGANDILVPVVRLYRQWPGGPIIGAFQARHGPDNQIVTSFTLRVGNADALPLLLDAGVKRMDEAYQTALQRGILVPDAGLAYVPPIAMPTPLGTPTDPASTDLLPPLAASGSTVVTIQVDTPSAASVDANEAALRALPGVSAAETTSLAIAGVSIVQIVFDAEPALLRTELEGRGWTVQGTGTTLRIRRAASPSPGGSPTDDGPG